MNSNDSPVLTNTHRQLPTIVPPGHIQCVLSDMDGTLLNSKHCLDERTVNAVSRIMRLGYKFFPCTGRSRRSAGIVGGDRFIKVSQFVCLLAFSI